MRTTYHLQYIVNNFEYFNRETLMTAKRELDKRLRQRTIKNQINEDRKKYYSSINSNN